VQSFEKWGHQPQEIFQILPISPKKAIFAFLSIKNYLSSRANPTTSEFTTTTGVEVGQSVFSRNKKIL
jgi:hypothetical protein